MKKLQYIILSALMVFALSSCELDVEPTEYARGGVAYSSLANTEGVITGAWKTLWEGTGSYTQSAPNYITLYLCSDYMGSDVAAETSRYGFADVYRFTAMRETGTSQITRIWTNAYLAIDNMNNVIYRIDDVPGSDETYRTTIKAQAHAFRGYLYYDLATFYGTNYREFPDELVVPMPITPTLDIKVEGQAKKSMSQIYKQAESDLTTAYQLMEPINYNRGGKKNKFDKNVIAGLLARLYLAMGEWDNAQKYAEIAHEGYSWMSQGDFIRGFNDENNVEWMWSHAQTAIQDDAYLAFSYKDVTGADNASTYYSMMCDPWFKKDFFDNDPGDARGQIFEWSLKNAQGYLKYKKFVRRSDGLGDLVLMRKAEMVLIEAEAYAEQGSPEKMALAIAKLNELRSVRGAATPDLSGLSKEDLIEEILIERRKELWGEGFSLSDIKRRGKAVERRAYPAEVVGQNIKGENVTAKGHSTTKLPDATDFVPYSVYYNFNIPTSEQTNNPNL